MRRFASSLLLLLSASALAAQDGAVGLAHTGDARLDRQLRDIDAYAARYPDAWLDELARYYAVSRDYAQALARQPGWSAGDVQFACALAGALRKDCREVVRVRAAAGHDADWRDVAKTWKARPGGGEYRQVRKAFDASYAHWARPQPE